MNEEEFDALQSDLSAVSYNELVQAMLAAQEYHNKMKQITSEAWDVVCAISRRIIPERFDRDGIRNITVTLPTGEAKQLVVMQQVSVKTPADKKGDLYAWLQDHDAKDLISETVNSSTLAAFVREQMKNGEPYPSDICEVSMYEVASLRKA